MIFETSSYLRESVSHKICTISLSRKLITQNMNMLKIIFEKHFLQKIFLVQIIIIFVR